ncbi:MAG: class I SAM-dependent methyltransferase, partial [Ktedonobacterales bacterium]|nr:class I SAM-dependent methyltransferase [Ktedonobacterales bacterium]
STAMLAQAAQRVGDQAQLMTWNLNDPPPAALVTLAPLDIILCTNVLHYVTNPQHAMKYFAQLLTPGGTVLVSDYIRHGWWWPLFEGIIHLADQAHHRTLTASAIERITTQAALTVTKTLTISAGGPWHGVLVMATLRERAS